MPDPTLRPLAQAAPEDAPAAVDGCRDPDPSLRDPAPRTGPPEADTVARRALALGAVALRALLEQDDPDAPRARRAWEVLQDTVAALDLGDELEPAEAAAVTRILGEATPREVVDGSWRCEAAAVLAWALGRLELRPDELVDAGDLLDALPVLDVQACRDLIARATLRPADELELLAEGAAAAAQALEAEAAGEGAAAVPEDLVRAARSLARERRRAASWLLRGGPYTLA